MDRTFSVAVVGATGLAGQQFIGALANHPWFELRVLAASSRSAGKTYRQAITRENGHLGWHAEGTLPERVAEMMVLDARELPLHELDIVFTAIDSAAAKELEPIYAQKVPVFSTASAFRYENDVPVLIPGVNGSHASLIKKQQATRGWQGFIVPNANCTTVGLAITLSQLHKRFGVKQVHMTSMQAVSGAGRSGGVLSLDSIDNILPFIPGEEEKVAKEARKILGSLDSDSGQLEEATFGVSATCTRVPISEGHTESVHVTLEKPCSREEFLAAWDEGGKELLQLGCPSAPAHLVTVLTDPFRPQVKLDRDCEGGLSTVVGRLRADEYVENGWKYMLVSHNTKMGAAKGCILVAEELILREFI